MENQNAIFFDCPAKNTLSVEVAPFRARSPYSRTSGLHANRHLGSRLFSSTLVHRPVALVPSVQGEGEEMVSDIVALVSKTLCANRTSGLLLEFYTRVPEVRGVVVMK